MTHNRRALQRLVDKEDFARIIQTMTWRQLSYAALRMAGLLDGEIAQLTGKSDRSAVAQTMRNTKDRITRHHPDLAHHLEGRANKHRPRLYEKRAFDWSWICDEEEEEHRD